MVVVSAARLHVFSAHAEHGDLPDPATAQPRSQIAVRALTCPRSAAPPLVFCRDRHILLFPDQGPILVFDLDLNPLWEVPKQFGVASLPLQAPTTFEQVSFSGFAA